MDHLEEDLTCSVCFNMFDDPRFLQCSHTFCRNCLENVQRSSDNYLWRLSMGRVKCPACRMITELSTGVDSLPVNFALKAIVEKYKINHCPSIKTCPEHRHQLNMYCLKDKKLICAQCLTMGQHQGHPIDDPDRAYIKERKTASKLLATLSDKKFTGVSSIISALEEQMVNCKNIVQEDKKEVLSCFDNLIETFEQKKQHFLAALNDLDQQIVETYAPQIEKIKQIQDEELDLISLSSSTQDEESPLVYLENIRDIQQRMAALKRQQLLPVQPVVIYPRVGQILQGKWLKTNTGKVNLLPIPKFGIRFQKEKNTQNNIPFRFLFIVLFISLIVFLIMCNSEMLPDFTTRFCTCFSEIMEPVLNYFGIHIDKVQTASQRLADLYFDFVSNL